MITRDTRNTIEDEIGTSETSNKTDYFEFANSDDERDNIPMRQKHVEEISDVDIDAL